MLVSADTDSIYFPALPAVGKDLHASEAAVAATVAVFLFTVGLGNLFWWGAVAAVVACVSCLDMGQVTLQTVCVLPEAFVVSILQTVLFMLAANCTPANGYL
jgi:MFS family permease